MSLFSLSRIPATLLLGVLLKDLSVSPFVVDAVIRSLDLLQAFENLSGFRQVFEIILALLFCAGLVPGFELATKLQELNLNPNGLLVNLISFNVGGDPWPDQRCPSSLKPSRCGVSRQALAVSRRLQMRCCSWLGSSSPASKSRATSSLEANALTDAPLPPN